MLDVRGTGYFEDGLKVGKYSTPANPAFIEGYTPLGNAMPWMRLTVSDNGTNTTAFLVENDGSLWCTSARVRLKEDIPVPDFVFQPNYALMPISEVKSYVSEHSHLPGVPSEEQIRTQGLNLEEMQLTLLQKIEELTLYMIQQDAEKEALQERINALETEVKSLKAE